MTFANSTLILGLTGPFGSGCSSAASLLEHFEPAFHSLKLSDVLRREHGKKDPSRRELQDLGDLLRKERGLSFLVEEALQGIDDGNGGPTRIVIDGIRNTGEIEYLRRQFGHLFFLLAVYAPGPQRWDRVRDEYVAKGLDEQDFLTDDSRDQDEETPEGQQVALCVDRADVFFRNSQSLPPVQRASQLSAKLKEYVLLLTSERLRYATDDEVMMNLAFSASHSTKCLKRQVGAVIASASGQPISVGYNENPESVKPCDSEFEECYRDRVRNEHFIGNLAGKTVCPECGTQIAPIVGPPWRCTNCKTNLEAFFFPDRAMKWCTALHAEERAIINAQGRDLRGSVIYTTSFPCFLCAEKILQAGISRIVFSDPYPDPYSTDLLDHAEPHIEVERFEGVKSGSFDRIFAGIRQQRENEVSSKRQAAFEAMAPTSSD